ncbi:hypothetical protein JRQ81_012363 [Phrynocephalus forsythii]|uniref:Zinc finger protein RFP-like n=1 Tax=Phrynocephalus forsythii TaxID=171643 RepID=A0A9Q1APY2_9SAUR|nr:hypothetical protein JRQ81_012363 [Phrynocephalus forsythii]
MAAASLQGLGVEATCSICLDYFKDPVITGCGHNFCRDCLAQCWEGSEEEEVPCPQCREQVRRNLIIPNRQLANVAELTKQLRLQEETRLTEGKGGVCGKHREPLKLFCKEDETPICVVCDRSKEHRFHDVVPLEEAAQDYKGVFCRCLELLEEDRAKIVACKAETGEESQKLIKQTKAQVEKTKEQFKELHSFLNRQEKCLLSHLEEVEKEIARKTEEHLARLSEEFSSLGGLMWEMEEKCQQPTCEFIQDVRNLLRSPALQTEICRLTLRSESSGIPVTLAFDFTLLLQTEIQKENVTLDPKTAHPNLILSEDLKSARNEGRCNDVPDNPERFNSWPCMLGLKGFTAGRHYWDITVAGEGSWAVGVAKKSVQRKGHIELTTEKGIWIVGKWRDGYRASDFPNKSFLPLSEKLRRIRVSLNYEMDQVAFHDVDTGSHLYTFSGTSFSGETLLPCFGMFRKASLTVQPNGPLNLKDLLLFPQKKTPGHHPPQKAN